MLVYADRSERRDPRACLHALADALAAIPAQPAGLARHAGLVGLLVEAGRLHQGVADAGFAEAGMDRLDPAAAAVGAIVHGLARAVCGSWDSRFSAPPALPPVPRVAGLPASVALRMPEGYAFYALYPEACIAAARRLRLSASPRVIGIRSIGTSLAAVAAAAIGAPPPLTLRPFGDPFDRRVAVAPALAEALLSPSGAHYVIVDEGPGRSGSSFGAVAAWLQAQGVPPGRIAFIASHDGGPGPDANAANRARWRETRRAIADIGPRLPRLLAGWAAGLLGPLDGPLVDVSAGAWRSHLYPDESAWPAVDPAQERRKYLARAGGATWLLRFAGLGAVGARKLARARALHAAGWTPEPRGLVHGFLVEKWHGEGRPAPPPVAALADYLGIRARLFPADRARGASPADLLTMSRRNVGLALGPGAAATLDRWAPRLQRLAACAAPVETDGRLDRHEWLCLPGGGTLKADALDHHAGHDLVGCQDVAWDIAGAATELSLDPPAADELAAAVGQAAGRPVDPELTEFFAIAYPSFRLGQAALAADALGDGPDRARLQRRARSLERLIERRLSSPA